MSPAHVLEPTYNAIRRRLIAGAWRPGYRLEAARLAQDFGVSITPVRDSLNRLTGERLVDARPGEGFLVPRLDGVDLRGLVNWHCRLVLFACAHSPAFQLAAIPHGHDGIAERTAILFSTIVGLSNDEELEWALGNVAARLAPYRQHEADVLPDAAEDLDQIEGVLRHSDGRRLEAAIDHYHQRRRTAADRLVQATRVR